MDGFNAENLIKNAKTVYSNRRTLSLEIQDDGSLIIRAPRFISQKRIKEFIVKKHDWIIKTANKVNARTQIAKSLPPLTQEEKSRLKKEAAEYFAPKIEHYAKISGIKYGKISYRFQKTRWGSCNRKGDISLNCLLMLAPKRVRQSVAVHELCHVKHFNHSSEFYKEITKLMPDYKEVNGWLKQNGKNLLARIK